MELHEIRYVLAVCKTRNFTRAAELCHVTQPALSRAIRKIEDEIGGPLFSRERGNTHLTALGRLLEPHFAQMIGLAAGARDAAARFLRLEAATVQLGVLRSIGPQPFMGFLRHFAATHPGIALGVSAATHDELARQLLDGHIDVAVLATESAELPAPLQAVPLYRERLVVACRHDHALAGQAELRLDDLDGQTCGPLPPSEICRAQQDWLQALVAIGRGVCIVPEHTALQPELVARPLRDAAAVRQICCVTVGGRRWPAPVAALVTALRHNRWQAEPPATIDAAQSVRVARSGVGIHANHSND